MAIALETLALSAHQELKDAYARYCLAALAAAFLLHLTAAMLAPPYAPSPYRLTDAPPPMRWVDFENYVIPGIPAPIVRPVLPGEITISDVADPLSTIPPNTDFFRQRAPALPGPVPAAVPFAEVPSTPPRVLTQVPPVYPELARQAGAEGRVVLRVTVDEAGRVADVVVHSTDAVTALTEAAVEAVRQWIYAPARQGDRPVRVQILVSLVFTLD